MSDRIIQWQQQIDDITRGFRDKFEDLTAQELSRQPNAGTWSIAENIRHLIVVNNSYFSIVDQLKAGNYKVPFLAKVPFFVNFMGNTILKSVEPARHKKLKTFMIWEPKAADLDAEILDDFSRHQESLKGLIRDARQFVDIRTVISSPANKNIVYTLEKAFEIIIAHEKRHFNQASEVIEEIYKNQYNYDL